MRVVVNLTRCQGYAQCAFLAPEVFRLQGAEALMYDPEPDEAQREHVLRAAAACPVQAIRVDRIDGEDSATAPTGVAAAIPARRAAHSPAAVGTVDQAIERLRREGHIVIVGASLAGLTAAATLRREGFTGSLTMIGEERHRSYDRPPLSKHVIDGWITADRTRLPFSDDVNAQWLLGVRATGLDPVAKQVLLADGGSVDYDRLLIATGTRARPWFNEAEAELDGVVVVRTSDDAAALRRLLDRRPRRVLIIGAGFTGSEVASVCRQRDLAVTVVERGQAPLVGALGGVIGAVAADLQREHGVDLRCGLTVTRLEGDDSGRLRRAHLSDGTALDADVAVVALGAVRNTEWLHDSGLAAGVWGVACDAGCRAFDINGVTTDDVFVAGDVARFPHPLYNYQFLALEHWGNAVTQAQVAAHNMVSAQADRWPHLASPMFWSNQFGITIKSVGVPTFADQVVITQGSLAERRFVAAYGHAGRIIAAVAFDQGKWLEFYQRLIEAAAPFPPEHDVVDRPAEREPMSAQMPEQPVRDLHATVIVTGHDPSERRAELIRHH
ncbi:NADPH-dependent 2,4-dienoyl-CoA reductase, sulfur reductase [Sinosporangium album]|uniref:NADPH-dependent 2,4-dienoyl-CoA reductase, sulfur reductase n=1 Tax=Sinosporangium album TaxID=504805 RepID=A0A1G7UFF3_9ACTN|nr:FAD-dependent oxidoreductase [Sinosporangium album]SDG46187.1 NADPH-dependent 2,4-dienoyl-CoA reductase, sulfur reductase [Sinosporangium album]